MLKFDFSAINIQALKSRGTFWPELIGNSSTFSMESRIFHSIALSLVFLSAVYIPYNLYAGLYVGAFSAMVLSFIFSYQYYCSRFQGRAHSTTIFAVSGMLIFGINYFTNSGIHGSTDLIWPIHLLLVLAISPYHHHVRWLCAYVLLFLSLHMLEYYYPALVQYPFTVGKGQFVDRVTAFPIPVFAVFIIIRYIRRSYDQERKKAEEKTVAIETSKQQVLLQKEQLEQSNSEKNKLMSIISHDLRTPLMNIQSYLELLSENAIDLEDRPMLEKALTTSTNNAVNMLSNLLNWSKSQMEGPSVHLVEADLFNALCGTLEMERAHASKKNITLDYDVPSGIMVLADLDMLQLVLRNLISNAVKFTPESGYINVKAELIASECKITVSDNGQGIPVDKRQGIFSIKSEPEFGTNNERGVGLGLVLCKEFTERQNGRIDFESELGVGTSFFVFIPLKG